MIIGYYVLLRENRKLYVNTDTTFNPCNGTLYGVSEDNKDFSMNTTLSFPDVVELSYYLDLNRCDSDGTYPINIDLCETTESKDEATIYVLSTERLETAKNSGFYLYDEEDFERRSTPSYVKGLSYRFTLTDINDRLGEVECNNRLRKAVQTEIDKASEGLYLH